MISFKRLKYLLLPLLFFLFFPSRILSGAMPNISLEELEAFEQELAKMTPAEWEALNNEINNTINNMSEEERQQLFADAALEAERLESEFKTLRQAEQPKTQESFKPEANSPVSAKKSTVVKDKPKVNQSEKIKNLEILTNLSDNLDYLQLVVSSSPLVKVKLESNTLWTKFLNDYYLLHSMINALINNSSLQESLLLSEWDNLRADIIKWNNSLNLIRDIQYSDNDDDISRSESDVIVSFIDKLLSNNSPEKLTWSLKRMMQKYSEEEFQKIEKFNKENKQVYRPSMSPTKDITTVKLGFPEKKGSPPKNYQPKYDNALPSMGASKNQKSKLDDAKSESADNQSSSKDKSAAGQGKSNVEDSGNEKPDQDTKKDDKKSSPDKKSEKKDSSFVQKPEKRLLDKLNKVSQDIKGITDGINDDIDELGQPLSPRPKLAILLQKFSDRLLILSFQLGQIQLDLMEFYDKEGKPDVKIAADLAKFLGSDNSFRTHAFDFAQLKTKFDPQQRISSFDIFSSVNKAYKIDDELKKRPETFQKNYNKLIKQELIKQGSSDDSQESRSLDNVLKPENLVYDIIDRLLTVTSLSDDQTVRETALEKLRNSRLAR